MVRVHDLAVADNDARSMAFSSSRTLPGQWYAISMSMGASRSA